MGETKRNQRRHARVQPKAMSSRVRIGAALHIGLGVENLSMGGAFVRCAHNPPARSAVTLELAVPGFDQLLVLPGRVAFTVTVADAATRKVSPGIAIEFQQPLPPHLEKGLTRLIGNIDPRAVAPLPRAPVAAAPVEKPPSEEQEELAALRIRFASQEREVVRLRRENEELKARLQKLLGGR
ncbi:MAG: PilZ domain-containing protein [Myxococcota bacterium]